MKDLLKSVVKALPDHKEHKADLHAVDYMDDGSRIALHVQIDGNEVTDDYFDVFDPDVSIGQSQI